MSTYNRGLKCVVHDHPLYLVCPGLLRVLGESSYGIRGWFIESTQSSLFVYLFIFICGV